MSAISVRSLEVFLEGIYTNFVRSCNFCLLFGGVRYLEMSANRGFTLQIFSIIFLKIFLVTTAYLGAEVDFYMSIGTRLGILRRRAKYIF